MTIDLELSSCPRSAAVDITVPESIPAEDDSAVVYVSCVLEYVDDLSAAMAEIERVVGSPDNIFISRVEPWTLTAYAYPGARRTISSDGRKVITEMARRGRHIRSI